MKPIALICCVILIAGCSVNKARIDDSLKTYFDHQDVVGCFTFLNNKTGKVTVYNLQLDTSRNLPAQTFDVVSSLIGLETGRIADEKMMIETDSVNASSPSAKINMSLEQAFRSGHGPYFREVVRRIGKDTLQQWLDSLHYGNKAAGIRPDSFWLDNTLKVSPDEQLGMMKRLYFDQLPFQKRSQQIVRDLMVREGDTRYTLAFKTGQGTISPGKRAGWTIGWIEENKHPYFFALYIESDNPQKDLDAAGMRILRDILSQYGFFKGNM
jgi:beta-lactamase class D